MNKQILFKSALSLVAAVAAGSVFAALPYNEDFESPWQEGDLITTDSQWAAGEGDASAIALGNGGQVLELKTEGATLTNTLADASEANTAIADGDKVVFEADVKFVPSDSLATDLPEGSDDTKFAIYAYAPEGGATNLVVYHASYVTGEGLLYTNDVLSATVDPEAFTKVTVKMFQDPSGGDQLYFTVALNNGQPLVPTIQDADAQETTWFRAVNDEAEVATTKALSAICFKGTGMVDNLGVSTQSAVATQITVTLNDGGFTATGLTVDGTDVSPIPETIDVDEGAIVAYTVQNNDGATKTIEIEATDGVTNEIDFTGATFGWADYLGAVVSGAYQIDDANDLNMLRKGVAAGLSTSGETFKQTADIDMASAGAFAGIGTYAKVPTSGTPFLGTYDGQGYTIANVTRAGGNTQGIFNQVGPAGVIENLVVSNMVFDAGVTGEYGFAIVGNAGGGATLRNLTAAGVFASAEKPSTHNVAGIVVRLSPGATTGAATTVDSCTNNATIYGGYTKLGGINAIVQDQTGFKDGKVVFVNCANNGTLVCKRTAAQAQAENGAVTGNAGIVGYISGTNVELTGCYGNGAITNADGANTDKDGALVGWTYGGTIKDNGGNSAPSNKKMIGTWGSATETGFQYATVDNGVATTIAPPYTLAAGGIYLLEGNAAPTIELAAGDSVTFDTALGYTLTDTGITAATGLVLEDSTSGTATTYSARALATPTVTVNGGANATAAWTVNGNPTSAPATLTEGDTYEVVYTADAGYKFADGATTTTNGTAGTENIVITISDAVALATPTVTVNGGANATAAWTVNGVSTNAPATLTEGDTYTVTYTADAGYEFAIGATTYAEGTAGTENIVIEIADAVAQSAPEPEKPSVNPGTGLAAYNTAHGTTLEPIAVTGSGFTMNFATTAPGTYTLMIATAVDGEYAESAITQTVTAEQAAVEGGALVTLTDSNVTGTGNEKKFYKIGWTAPSAN